MPSGAGGVASSDVSKLRRWALRSLVVADGPRAGRPFRIASPPWGEVLDAMDDPDLEQVTIRGSIQSGKTATLIAAGLGHMAAGRSVLIFEPDDRLKRTLAARLIAWGRACRDLTIREAFDPKRPPFVRSTDAGGRLEVISAREGGAGVMRTAEIVIVDELRLFHKDLLGDLIDRMAAYGGRGRLITASSAGYEHECKTSTELEKSDSRHWFLQCPSCGHENVADWRNVVYGGRRYPVYVMPCCGASLEGIPFRRAMQAGRWKPTKDPMVPGTRGYHLDAFTSPFESLRTIVRQWKRADAHRKQTGSMAEVISFQTGRLAIPYKPEAVQGVTPEGIRSSCREDYDPAIAPAGACVLIGAVDVQDNRLEAEVSAWGLVEVEKDDASQLKGWGSHEFRGLQHNGKYYRLRRWAMEYRRFYGDPGSPDLWHQLAEFMEQPRPHATGPLLRPVIVGVDIGGHYGPQVAEFVKDRGMGYQCLKGLPPTRYGAVLARRSITVDSLEDYGPSGLLLVCGNSGKASCFSLMRQSIAGTEPKPTVWPMDESRYGLEEFEGICSESLMRTLDKKDRIYPPRVEEDRATERAPGPDVLLAGAGLSPGDRLHAGAGIRYRRRRRPGASRMMDERHRIEFGERVATGRPPPGPQSFTHG